MVSKNQHAKVLPTQAWVHMEVLVPTQAVQLCQKMQNGIVTLYRLWRGINAFYFLSVTFSVYTLAEYRLAYTVECSYSYMCIKRSVGSS